MAPKKKLFLHIGFPKTGTTAVQTYFSLNRDRFRNHDVLYVESGDTPYSGQAGLAFAAKDQLREPFHILQEEIRDSACRRIVISSEYFFVLEESSINFLKDILLDYDVKIIVYFRPQDVRIESGYLQVLRDAEMRFSGSIDDYIKFLSRFPRRLDYYQFIQPWSKAFGREAISIGFYDEVKDRLVNDFLQRCDIEVPRNVIDAPREANAAYRPIINKFLRFINIIPMTPRTHSRITRALNFLTRNILGSGTVRDHKLLSDSQRAAILKQYSSSNSRLLEEYTDRGTIR